MTPQTVPISIAESIRTELLRLIQDPDLEKNLPAIERVAQRSVELFLAFKSPEAKVRRRRGTTVYASPPSIEDLGGDDDSSYNAAETFGAKAIRELLATLPNLIRMQKETTSELVHALVAARGAGDLQIAAELEIKLFGKTLPPRPLSPVLEPILPAAPAGNVSSDSVSWATPDFLAKENGQ